MMLPVLLHVGIFFMAFPDRVPGKTFRQMLFRQDMMFDNILVSENVVFQISDIKNAISCARSCLAQSECDSFFYNEDRQVCSGQQSSLNQTSAGFSQPGSRYFKPIRQPSTSLESAPRLGSCYENVTEAASRNGIEKACPSGLLLKINSEINEMRPLVTQKMTIGGLCLEDRWTWTGGSSVTLVCTNDCLVYNHTSTDECTSVVMQWKYVCQV
ncbi:uncharacterized protein LOC125379753 isoform X2 [Haliotis rufescens]|uniref:uncharacterized protein LOC125379753 isoform X2 n=1 Tax=Haliotis rufescens TaxID=6454 RepID=UPI00201F2276|nr:uncharacterized protein LOC125379753 isoform X2 [Haliotis rufescens]